MTDEQLVWLIVSFNSEKAKDRLVRRHYDSVYAFAYRRLGRADDAYDAAQDIFIKALRALPSFDKRRAVFKTWLYAIASNHLRDMLRSVRFTEVLPDELPDPERFEEIAETRGAADQIMRWLERADGQAYRIVEMKIFCDMTFEEIGAALVIPANTAKTRYYAAIRKCRKEFESYRD